MRDIEKDLKRLAKRVLRKGQQKVHQLRNRPKRDPQTRYDVDVSVVIPVYNCEEYIAQTILSISDHTQCRFEIIAINDESPDDALQVMQALAKDIPQLKVFDQKNIGGANTLNRGLAMAQGKYVTFLDCDDWLAPRALDTLFEAAEARNAQIVGGVVQKYTDGLYDDIHDFSYIKKRMDITVATGIPRDVFIDSFYTGKLFSRFHLESQGITFNPGLLYADRPFVTKSMVTAQRITFLPDIVGFWRKHIDGRSVTDGFSNPNNFIDKMSGFGALLRDPAITAKTTLHKTIFLEAFKRLTWHYKDATDADFAKAFAFGARALIAGYPGYKALPSGQMPLRYKLVFDQISQYPDVDFHAYRRDLESVILATAGSPVAQIAAKMKAVPHVGKQAKGLPPYPTIKNPNMIVFESFFGKTYGANPRYLYEAMVKTGRQFTAVWVHSPKRKPFKMTAPPNVNLIQVARGSAQYHQLLREARYWVNNIRFPEEAEKTPGTVYIQTWHGTPLKRLGLDIDATGPEMAARASFLKDASQWDYLLAQNDYSAEIFARAFDVKCPILVDGYPANDVLADTTQQARAAKYIRKKYGIPDNKKIITYAPTWRDRDQVGDTWVFANKIALDFQALREKLGDEYVVVLRLHHLMARAVSFSGLEGFLYDGSKEPDANRLMAATDLLITDYSSIFFDYACSGKPMLFYMYDLDEYEQELRGFYIDPREELPGPIVQTQEALVDAVKDIDSHVVDYADRYRTFHEKFLAWDKGHSAKAIAARVFSPSHNEEDLASLPKLRQTQDAHEKAQRLAHDCAWTDAEFDYDVSIIVPISAPTKDIAKRLTRMAEHNGVQAQVLAVGSRLAALPKGFSQNVTRVSLPAKADDKTTIDAVLAAAKGKFVIQMSLDATWQPDTLQLLVAKAEAAQANMVLADRAATLRRGQLLPADLVQSGYMDAPVLSGKMILTIFMRHHVPVLEIDWAGLITVLLCETESAVASQIFPRDLSSETARLGRTALTALHLSQSGSEDTVQQVFTTALDTLADTDEQQVMALIGAYPAHIRWPDVPLPQQVKDYADTAGIDTETARFDDIARSAQPAINFDLPLDRNCYFILCGPEGLTERGKQTMLHIALTQRAAMIVTDDHQANLNDILTPAPGVHMRHVALQTPGFWYWLQRAASVFVDGTLPDDIVGVLRKARKDRRLVQLSTCHDLAPFGWTKARFAGVQLLDETLPWTDILVDQWAKPSRGKGVRRYQVKGLRQALLQDATQMTQQNETFRAQNRIQRNKLLVGVMQLADAEGCPDVLVDVDHLAGLLPPKSQVFVFDTNTQDEAQLNGFLCACDVLISPPHPSVVDYLATGKPLLPQHSHVVPVGDAWKVAADAYQTHDALVQAVHDITNNTVLEPQLTVNLSGADPDSDDFSDVLTAILEKADRT